MAKKKTEKMVHCRYPKCNKLHESTELKKSEAVQGGSARNYYHPDCYHIMQTVNKIRDLFYKEINPMMTGQQIGQLVSIVNNMVFSKNIDVDYIAFALDYFIRYKPGALKYPGGISYIVQDRDVASAWEKEKERKIRDDIKKEIEKKIGEVNLVDPVGEIGGWIIEETENKFVENNKKSKFSRVLGV